MKKHIIKYSGTYCKRPRSAALQSAISLSQYADEDWEIAAQMICKACMYSADDDLIVYQNRKRG